MTIVNVTRPVVTGTPKQGNVLQTSDGTWTFDDDYLTFVYEWRRCDAAGANCVTIVGATGQSYVVSAADIGYRLESRVTATEHVTPPTPGDELLWSPPTLGAGGVNIVEYTVTNANRGSSTLSQGAGRDLHITCGEVLDGPLYTLMGWRNIVWIGGEFNSSAVNASGHIILREITGTVHLEGIKFRQTASGSGDCIVVRANSSGVTIPAIQVQNCDLRVQTLAGVHSDIYQTQLARVNELRVDKCTFTTNYQGIFVQNETGYTNPTYHGPIRLSRLNYKAISGAAPAGSWMYKALDDDDAFQNNLGPWTLDDVWIPNVGTPAGLVYPINTFVNYEGGGTHKYGCFARSDVDGNYVAFSTTADTVPTGTYAGQQAKDCQISGKLRVGTPPGGDFCTTAGMSYVSPGYQ